MQKPYNRTRKAQKSPEPSKYLQKVIEQRFSVPFDYPVYFTRDLFSPADPLFASVLDRFREKRRHRAVFYIDSNVAKAHPQLTRRIREYFNAYPNQLELAGCPHQVPGGPTAKSEMEIVRDIMTVLAKLHLDRQSYVVCIGGGSVLDMVGFSASLVHRGLRCVRVPSTTLAQDDAGIGIKNGMDIHGQKNFVGTFAPPFAVLNDFSLLPTLNDQHWIGGVAEAFKVAIIKDRDFFDVLCKAAPALRNRGQEAMEGVICRCAQIHLEHIRNGGDPFELGSTRPLDFGHWAGHQLENVSGYRIPHGQAVSVGIALDSRYALQTGLLNRDEFDRILHGLQSCGLPVWHDLLKRRDPGGRLSILGGLELLREHLGGILNVTLPNGIGKKIEVNAMETEIIEESVQFLEDLARE